MRLNRLISLSLIAAFGMAVAQVAPQTALDRLMQGNERFVEGKVTRPNQTVERRVEQSKGQKPFAIVVGCADSRVSPELVFDQGIGDLFVVRTAGNTVDRGMLGSIEFGVQVLGARLIVVKGHDKCGAVIAAVDKPKVSNNLQAVLNPIQGAIRTMNAEDQKNVEKATEANVKAVVKSLRDRSPALRQMIDKGELRVVGGVYKLESGKFELVK